MAHPTVTKAQKMFGRQLTNLNVVGRNHRTLDAFKLAILRHKAEGWQQISRSDVLASLDALKELAMVEG